MKDLVLKTMKEVHPETVILIQIGAFYHVYGKDSYILSYLLGYQIKSLENNYNTCGFPKTSLNKTLKYLEDKKISYIVTCKALNYEVDQEMAYKDKNRYTEIYEKAYKYITLKNRISKIQTYLLENIDSPDIREKIRKIEDEILGIG